MAKPIDLALGNRAHFWGHVGQECARLSWPHQGYRALQPAAHRWEQAGDPHGHGHWNSLVNLTEKDGSLNAE